MTAEAEAPSSPSISRKLTFLMVASIAILHIGLALWFASNTPYRKSGMILSSGRLAVPDVGAPDERQHVNYVAHLLEGEGFPVLKPGDPHLDEDYQSHQPPAFYVLEAAWSKLLGVGDVDSQDSGLKLRALNCLLGGANVIAGFCLGFWGFRKIGVGLGAACVIACLPMNVALSGAVSNDPLLFLLCTTTLALCARSIHLGWTVNRAVLIGMTVGLALLTKTTALALLPAVLVAVVMSPTRPGLKVWLAAQCPMFLLPLGWWIRDIHLYGDPFAISAFNQAFVGSPQAKAFMDQFGLATYLTSWVGWWTLRSFFGAFGYMDIWLNESGMPTGSAHNLLYRLLVIFSLALLAGWLGSWKRYPGKAEAAVQQMNLCFGIVVALLFLGFNLHYFQAQARYLLPALGPIACAFSLGANTVLKGRWPLAVLLLLVVFGGTSIYAGTRLAPEFEKRTTS